MESCFMDDMGAKGEAVGGNQPTFGSQMNKYMNDKLMVADVHTRQWVKTPLLIKRLVLIKSLNLFMVIKRKMGLSVPRFLLWFSSIAY